MMVRIAYLIVSVLALGAIGCGRGSRQQNEITAAKAAVSPVVEQPKPVPAAPPVSTAPAEPPAVPVSAVPSKSRPERHTYNKARHVVAVPRVQCVPGESPACELATEILNLPLAERLAWAKQEFAKREINDVRNDQ
jgi:hypothetical protein